jgi:hypothetical protein
MRQPWSPRRLSAERAERADDKTIEQDRRTAGARSSSDASSGAVSTDISAIGEENEAIIKHREGNAEGTVLTPAPTMNYVPLYALQMLISLREEPLEERSRSSFDEIGEAEMTLLDTAITLQRGQTPAEPAAAPSAGRCSVKRWARLGASLPSARCVRERS